MTKVHIEKLNSEGLQLLEALRSSRIDTIATLLVEGEVVGRKDVTQQAIRGLADPSDHQPDPESGTVTREIKIARSDRDSGNWVDPPDTQTYHGSGGYPVTVSTLRHHKYGKEKDFIIRTDGNRTAVHTFDAHGALVPISHHIGQYHSDVLDDVYGKLRSGELPWPDEGKLKAPKPPPEASVTRPVEPKISSPTPWTTSTSGTVEPVYRYRATSRKARTSSY